MGTCARGVLFDLSWIVSSDTGVAAYAVHPGIVRTELKRHMNLGLLIMWKVVRPFTKTPVQGAQTTIYCAVQPELDKESGGYYRYWIVSYCIKYSCRGNTYKLTGSNNKFVLFVFFCFSHFIKQLQTFKMH